MVDITSFIISWVKCCQDVWAGWFANLENGDDEFLEVEEVLFSTLVLSQINSTERPSLADIYPNLTATYLRNVVCERSVCHVQKGGNIFCQPRAIDHKIGAKFPVRAFDCLGTMLDGEAYVELEMSEGEFLLEPICNVALALTVEAKK